MNLDALLAPIQKEVKPCKLGLLIQELEDPYKSALQTMTDTKLEDGGLSDNALSERTAAAGIRVSRSVIREHRRNTCSCFRGAK